MKKLYALAGVLLLTVMLSSIGLVAAEQLFPTLTIPALGKATGLVWVINTRDVTDFSGFDVKLRSIVCTVTGAVDGVDYVVKPLLILPTKDYVIIVFLPRAFPQLPLDPDTGLMYSTNYVSGELKNGDTFIASGPGFAMGGHF
jgi:hypothetical protein